MAERKPALVDTSATDSQTSSTQSEQGAPSPATPVFPDGGWLAWLQVAGTFVVIFNTWGLLNAYGAYQQFYQSSYLAAESPSRIAWIGSIQSFFLVFGSIPAGPLFDVGYLRAINVVGSVLLGAGMMLTSLATRYWQLVLAQGVLVGLANGLMVAPATALVCTYFAKKRAIAVAIASTGGCIGGIIYSTMLHKLLPVVGFGWATRTIAFIILGLQTVPIVALKQRYTPPNVRALVDMSALRDPAFLWFCASVFFAFLGVYIPFFYVQAEALRQHTITGELNFYLVAILNASSFGGRIIPGFLADRYGSINTLIPFSLATAVVAYCWIPIQTAAPLIVFCVLYGFFSGAIVSIKPTITAHLCPNLAVLGTRSSMLAVPMSLGLLIGTPIAGIAGQNNFAGLKGFCGSAIVVSAGCMLVVRFLKAPSKARI